MRHKYLNLFLKSSNVFAIEKKMNIHVFNLVHLDAKKKK